MKIVLEYEWIPVESAPGIRYYFPERVTRHLLAKWRGPAIYRWVVFQREPGDLRELYLGETERLERRVNHYLNPGPSQQTNQRLNAEFQKELSIGHKVTLEVLCFDRLTIDGTLFSVEDLADKKVRRFLENLFEVYYSKAAYTLLNR